MSKWLEVEVKDSKVKLGNGNNLNEGGRIRVGMGFIELRNTPKAGLHVVRLSRNGHYKYSFGLKQDGVFRFGPEYGHRVISVKEETDPIKRLLRELEIPVSVLKSEADILNGATPYNTIITDGVPEDSEKWSSGFLPLEGHRPVDYSEERKVANATYVISVYEHRECNRYQYQRIVGVYVAPDCDLNVFSDELAKAFYRAPEADWEFTSAMKDVESARTWLERYDFHTKSNQDGFSLKFNPWGYIRTIKIGQDCYMQDGPWAIRLLINKHGRQLIDKMST